MELGSKGILFHKEEKGTCVSAIMKKGFDVSECGAKIAERR